MNRREFITYTTLGAAASAWPMRLYAQPEPYSGRLLVVLQAEGGWDVTSFCDPKTNVPGEREINQWARTMDIQRAGNIDFAPIAGNIEFFEKYHRDMLVINGVDAQTNSHSTGVLHNWSGRSAAGFPGLTALFSAAHAPHIPLSYINFGGFSDTRRLIRSSRVSDFFALATLLQPNTLLFDRTRSLVAAPQFSIIRQQQLARIEKLHAEAGYLPRSTYNIESQRAALNSKVLLERLVDLLPTQNELEPRIQVNPEVSSTLRQQIQLLILTFRAGIASSADLHFRGFDTHSRHDELHTPLLAHFTEAVDYFWDYAEQQGVADRITLVAGSDFGRTPHYNAEEGKDHWPIGSVLIMEKNPAWGDRVVGVTDEGHNALSINPRTLARDDSEGTIIYPKHVHNALREYLGIANTPAVSGFEFTNTEDFAFFQA